MSTNTADHVPDWDVADRLRKSLREAHIGVTDMADYLDVGRNTVSNWINGRTKPPVFFPLGIWRSVMHGRKGREARERRGYR